MRGGSNHSHAALYCLTFWIALLFSSNLPAATIGTGDLNTNQFVITGLSKVSLRNGASVTNLTFNSFTICDPGTTNCTTYNWPLTNYVSGQFLTVITNGTNVFIVGTNLPTSTVVFDTIEELVATPIPLPGIGMLAYVRDPLRSGPLAFYPASVDTTNRFDTYASLDGPGNWKRPPDPNVYPQHGVVTGGLVTNDTLVAALVLQSSRATGKVVYSGTDEFLETDDVPLLDNNVLFFEDGAQATGLVLSANGKTNVAVYGAYHIAAVADPSIGAYYLTNSTVLIQSPTFLGYSGNPVVNSGSSVRIFTFDSTGFVLQAGNGLTNLVVSDASGYLGTGTKALFDDGTYKVPGGGVSDTLVGPLTPGYVPYATSTTNLSDSSWYRISANHMGFSDTNIFLVRLDGNLGLGRFALKTYTIGGSGGNTAIGYNALPVLTGSGSENVAIGASAGLLATTASGNVLIGVGAGESLLTGISSTIVGANAAANHLTHYAVAIGAGAGNGADNLQESIVIGTQSFTAGEPTTRDFTRGVWLGSKVLGNITNWPSVDNAIVIGSSVIPRASDTAQIGTNGVNVLYLNGSVGWFRGSTSPEGSVTAPIGSYFTREDGGAGTSFYVKESGTGDTGWVAVSTGAGSGITGSGTANTVMKWGPAGLTAEDSVIGDPGGGVVTMSGQLEVEDLVVTNSIVVGVDVEVTGNVSVGNGLWDPTTEFDPQVPINMNGFDIDMGTGRITNSSSYNGVNYVGTAGTTQTFPATGATILGDLATTSTATPQFARMGLGVAADATASLKTAGAIYIPAGTLAAPSLALTGFPGTGLYFPAGTGNFVGFGLGGSLHFGIESAAAAVVLYNSKKLSFDNAAGSGDLHLTREAAAILQQGIDAATATAQTHKAHDGLGSDKDGARMTIGAGRPTGTGVIPRVMIAVSTNAVSGSTALNYGTPVAVGGTLKVNTTTTGNVGGGEDDLISYTIPAAELGVNGDYIEYRVWGFCAANTNTKDIKIYFGGTVLGDGGVTVLNGVSWSAHGMIVRTSATAQTATCELTAGVGVVAQTTTTAPAETLSGTVVFKVTGTSAISPNNDDIVQNGMVVKWYPGQ